MSINARCANCRFSHVYTDPDVHNPERIVRYLTCRRYPPTGTDIYVYTTNWCGEYQPNITPSPPNQKLEDTP